MDFPVIFASHGRDAPVPAVVWANYFQFAPAELVRNSDVRSRMFLWGISGLGTLTFGCAELEVSPRRWLLLPWRHDVTYRADAEDPFLVGAIHLIPRYQPRAPILLGAAHGKEDVLAEDIHRQDADWPELRGVVAGNASGGDLLLLLADVIVRYFQRGETDPDSLRAFAVALISVLRGSLRQRAAEPSVPAEIQRIQAYVASHPRARMSVSDIARVADVSESTLQRLFRMHVGTSVASWMSAHRLSRARELLETTNLNVTQVAAAVGYDDPLYFSRAYRRAYGSAPSADGTRGRRSP